MPDAAMSMSGAALIPALQRIFTPRYQHYMRLTLGGVAPSLPISELFQQGWLEGWLARCATRYRMPDARGIASYWAQRYVFALLPAALVANLVLGRELPLGWEQTAVCIDVESGLPQTIWIPGEGAETLSTDVFTATHTLIKAHLEPFALALASQVRISPRVITSSAAFLAHQILHILQARDLLRTAYYEALFAQHKWGDGSSNPLFRPVSRQVRGRSGLFKRVCCLSYTLAEVGRCNSCPMA